MPEKIEEWAALSAFVVTVAAAFAGEQEIMAVSCVASIIYTLVIIGKGK
jgi:hypothetical protein